MKPRPKRTRGSRKQLREARLLTLASALFVAAGVWLLLDGDTGFGLVTTLFFSACLIVGIALWATESTAHRGGSRGGRAMDRFFALLMTAAALLMGLGSFALLITTLADPARIYEGTAFRYTPGQALIASLVGTVLFGGGFVVLLIRGLRRRKDSVGGRE